TAPSNSFNQLGLQGGYTLAPKTKLVANFSYGRNTQNSAFVTPETGLMRTAAQATSLNGEVINTHADVKITDQSYQNLTLSGAFKFDERDNQTTSYLYNFNAISGAHTALYANNPLSHKKALLEFAGDYKFKPGHGVRVALLREDIDRWCNSFAYPVGANCVTAKSSKDDRVEATYRMKANDVVDLRV
ncbi:MAG: MtrB/PioB family outer membrane beta-barrel protein, partial [Rhodoferax sp.]|nr:MtrB/PioB family outer membrane beta-barrel protein [Rhodoferax sp.]